MPIVFAPAIENKLQKEWHTIYLDGNDFESSSKKQDAYTILSDLVKNLVSVVYQHLGQWYVEGLNKRSLEGYSARLYSSAGVYIQNTTVTKIVRDLNGNLLATPNITIVPPYGQITVETEQTALGFPETLYTEKNDGWSPAIGVIEEIYATEWYHGEPLYARAKAPDYKVYLENNEATTFVNSITTLRRYYVKQNTKVKITLEFSIDYFGTENSDTIDNLVADGDWVDPFGYTLWLGDRVLFTNTSFTSAYTTFKSISFASDKKAKLTLEFIAVIPGELGLFILEPSVDKSDTKIAGIFIENVELEDVSFNDTGLYVASLTDDFTLTKEVELAYTDDITAMSVAFRLAKLNQRLSTAYNTIEIPILSAFTQNGKYYCVVQLDGANLIADNREAVLYNSALITINDVIYNYNDGEQMVVETATAITSGSFTVRQYRYRAHNLDRTHWEQWTDSVYEVESKRYGDAVLGVYSRLFDVAYPKLDATAHKMPILFADLIRWTYIEDSLFVPTYLDFNFDSGNVAFRAVRSNYLLETSLIPPFVDAGQDLYLFDDESVINIDATAFDPDGTIVSYLWEQVSGDTTAVFSSTATEDVAFSNLTGNAYEFRLTVTDNDGLTASDNVIVSRVVDYELSLSLVDSSYTDELLFNGARERERIAIYDVVVTPQLPNSKTIQIDFTSILETVDPPNFGESLAEFKFVKNNIELVNYIAEDDAQITNPFSVNYIDGDVLRITVRAYLVGEQDILFTRSAESKITMDFASIINDPGVVTGLPTTQSVIVEI